MKALIDTTSSVNHIISWNDKTPVIETYPNSQRLCEVAEQEFPVADNLFWIDCANDVVADQFYYDFVTQTINPVVNVEPTMQPQPVTEGTQTA
jgi:hypothetical protein